MFGTPYDIHYICQCEALHFLSSALAGLLAFWLILTISCRAWPALATSRRSWLLSALAWCCALCAATAIHWYADLAAWGF